MTNIAARDIITSALDVGIDNETTPDTPSRVPGIYGWEEASA